MKKQNVFPVELGKTIVMEPTGNFACRESNPLTGKITSIKRKYFYVTDQWNREHGFSIETFDYNVKDCNGGYILWETKEAFQTELNRRKEVESIRKFLGSHKYGYDALSPEDTHTIFEIISNY